MISVLRRQSAALVVSLTAASAHAESDDPFLLIDEHGLTVRGYFQLGFNVVAERHLFWDLAATTAPGSGFEGRWGT